MCARRSLFLTVPQRTEREPGERDTPFSVFAFWILGSADGRRSHRGVQTFNGSALGCTVPHATSTKFTNLDALLKIQTINASYLFGVKNDSAYANDPIKMFTFQKGKGYFNDHLTNGARQSRQLLYAHIGVRCVPARVPRVIARSVPSCCTVPAVAFCS